MERQKSGEYKKSQDVTFTPKPSLAELGISNMESSRWQLEASTRAGFFFLGTLYLAQLRE
jgi:hypothetical protein